MYIINFFYLFKCDFVDAQVVVVAGNMIRLIAINSIAYKGLVNAIIDRL